MVLRKASALVAPELTGTRSRTDSGALVMICTS
jgi:hypothetical protein